MEQQTNPPTPYIVLNDTANTNNFKPQTTKRLSPYENFIYALKSKDVKRQYPSLLNRFCNFLDLRGTFEDKCNLLIKFAKEDPDLLQSNLMRYCNFQKERIGNGEISEGTMRNYIKAIRLFYEMNEIHIFWKKITKGLPTAMHASEDRPPTINEISMLVKGHPDSRVKIIVLVMLSSGIRVGAWNYLRWKHIEPIHKEDTKENTIIAAKITVYAGTPERYYSFITPEAYYAVKDWIDYRKIHGEIINGESWVMRDIWQKIDRSHGHRIGLAKYPKQLDSEGIRTMLDRAWKVQGIREKLEGSAKNHHFKSSHGFRKFFQTICEQKMISANVERIMGHNNGLKDSYYKPTEREVLNDYLKVTDQLTINEENKLKNKIIEISNVNKNNEQVIKCKLDERDEEIKALTKKQEQFEQVIQNLIDSGQLKPQLTKVR